MTVSGWVVWVVVVLVAAVCVGGAVRLLRAENARDRIRLPARELGRRATAGGVAVFHVEYPGPDGRPVRAHVPSARRTGVGATPPFSGQVWVDRNDPSDVVLRPHARYLLPGALLVTAGVLLTVALVVTSVVLGTALGD